MKMYMRRGYNEIDGTMIMIKGHIRAHPLEPCSSSATLALDLCLALDSAGKYSFRKLRSDESIFAKKKSSA